jgi:integrase
MHKRLTELTLKSLRAPAQGRLVVADTQAPGLSFRVSAAGKRDWLVRYRVKGRPGQRATSPGPYPAVTLAAARERALKVIAAAKGGNDLPEQERQRAALALAARKHTVANVAQEFVRRRLREKGRAPSYVAAVERMFNDHVLPRWRDRDIHSITRGDVVALLDAIADDGYPILANRTLAAVRAMFNWAINRGILESSPAHRLDRPGEERQRDRTLSADEIGALWPQFVAAGYPFGKFFQMTLATGQRREEVARMRWADIDLEGRTWNLSSEQTKARRAHIVPLSDLAIDILTGAREEAGKLALARGEASAEPGAYVFTTTGDRPIRGFGKAKARVDKATTEARAKDGLDALAPWTIHDLRRTVATGLGMLGASRLVIGRLLNHADKSVTGIYDKHDYLAEKRHALDAWSTYLGNVTKPRGANVVAIGGKARGTAKK